MADDVASGGAKYLSQFSDVTSLLGKWPSSDLNSGNRNQPWLFNTNLFADIKGSSAAALVLTDFGSWTAPQMLSGARNRRLRIDIYQDGFRDAGGNVTSSDQKVVNSIMHIFNVLHLHLQRRDNDTVTWGDMVTYACTLLTEPVPAKISDGDWAMMGTAVYGVSFSGWTDALG